jgi:excisionase family DNA binding protein
MEYLTVAEAAAELGLNPATLRSQIRYRAIEARRVGPIWTISRKEVERYRAESLGKAGRSR